MEKGDIMNQESRNYIKRIMQFISDLYSGRVRETAAYCQENVEWKLNHFRAYGAYNGKIREAVKRKQCDVSNIEHHGYYVHTITQGIVIVSGSYSIYWKRRDQAIEQISYEITVCMHYGRAAHIQIYGGARPGELYKIIGVDEQVYYVELADIIYLESNHNQVIWHCVEFDVVVRDSLKNLEGRLREPFVRIQRGYIVNKQHVRKIQRCEVQMSNGDILPIPSRKYIAVREQLKAI